MTRFQKPAASFTRQLATFAELCVARGINLQHDQELIVTAPLEAAPLVHAITRSAYARGGKSVTCLYEDPQLIRDQLTEAGMQSLDYAPEGIHRGVLEGMRSGAARLQIVGPYPDLLSGISVDRIARAHRARTLALRAEEKMFARSEINWCMVPFVTTAWAQRVFPEHPEDLARERLWDALFDSARISDLNPFEMWDAHLQQLNARRAALQSRSFRSLRFFDGETDLIVKLAEGHQWIGGSTIAANGVDGVQKIPAEEIFTTLDWDGAQGKVLLSRPIALAGTVVENLHAEFDRGVLTKLSADRGLETFERLVADDERARRLGEVGLVPASSRLARAGIRFWNPLLDRNSASHLAFGTSRNRPNQPENESADERTVHIDCMFGSDSMDVDGITQAGEVLPLMRAGEFVEFESAACNLATTPA